VPYVDFYLTDNHRPAYPVVGQKVAPLQAFAVGRTVVAGPALVAVHIGHTHMAAVVVVVVAAAAEEEVVWPFERIAAVVRRIVAHIVVVDTVVRTVVAVAGNTEKFVVLLVAHFVDFADAVVAGREVLPAGLVVLERARPALAGLRAVEREPPVAAAALGG